ncbi:FeoA family protein [Gracilinema caldarium]|uniref:FeoA family protein n=1 Tax=Gracilinema caldarium TaxID=215591 RepID=UPI0026ED8B68|nr:FeoA family protein [Gracilinema caldarium]
MFLSDAPNGASFKVIRVLIGKEVGKRLADMGFTEGAEGAVVRGGLFRGPLQVRIRGYDVLIRRSEAAGIEVEPVGDWTAAEDAARLFGPFGRFGRHGHGRFGRHDLGRRGGAERGNPGLETPGWAMHTRKKSGWIMQERGRQADPDLSPHTYESPREDNR